jgi:hypothetical protein
LLFQGIGSMRRFIVLNIIVFDHKLWQLIM